MPARVVPEMLSALTTSARGTGCLQVLHSYALGGANHEALFSNSGRSA